MTELERLKALLDERGEPYVENDFGITWRYTSDPHTATESMDGTLIVTGMTARQAIDATIGRGECRLMRIDKEDCDTASDYMMSYGSTLGVFDEVYVCQCGSMFGHASEERPNFCPNCGTRIKGAE